MNNGNVYVGPYATLNLTNQPNGITDIVAGSGFAVSGAVNNVMTGTSAFANLTSIEGYLNLGISPQFGYFNPTTITPIGGTLSISNTGNMDASFGAGIQVNGSVDNFGSLSTSRFSTLYGYYYGPNTLGISGVLTNQPELKSGSTEITTSRHGHCEHAGEQRQRLRGTLRHIKSHQSTQWHN